MSRPKGSKNKKTLEREKLENVKSSSSKGAVKNKKIKKVVSNDTTEKHIKEVTGRKTSPKKVVKRVIKLTDWLYITCDAHTWILKEVNDKVNPQTGEHYPDVCLLYSPWLDNMLQLAVHYMIRVPADAQELSKKLSDIYGLISARVPADVRPKDLFEEYKVDEKGDSDE